MEASSSGHMEDVAALLPDAGAHKDLQDLTGRTALMDAVAEGNARVARLLLDDAARTDLPSIFGLKALMCQGRFCCSAAAQGRRSQGCP